MELCIACHEKPIEVKKRQLCKSCYMREYRTGGFEVLPPKKDIEHEREMEFMKNFFEDADDYVYEPAFFNLKTTRYTPDFYDIDRNIFIEVVGTREAYRQNKHKYELFRHYYPSLVLELRAPCGELIDEEPKNKNLRWPKSVDGGKKQWTKLNVAYVEKKCIK